MSVPIAQTGIESVRQPLTVSQSVSTTPFGAGRYFCIIRSRFVGTGEDQRPIATFYVVDKGGLGLIQCDASLNGRDAHFHLHAADGEISIFVPPNMTPLGALTREILGLDKFTALMSRIGRSEVANEVDLSFLQQMRALVHHICNVPIMIPEST